MNLAPTAPTPAQHRTGPFAGLRARLAASFKERGCSVTDEELNRIRLVMVVKFCIALEMFAFCVRLYVLPDFTWQRHTELTLISLVFLLLEVSMVHVVDFWMNKSVPYARGLARRVVLQITATLLIAYALNYVAYEFVEPFLPEKVRPVGKPFILMMDTLFIVVLNLLYFGIYFFYNWREEQLKNERVLKESAQVRFDALKNQLNPHFLFNSLASLNSLIYENQELASLFVQQLSRVYRYVLQSKDKELVSVAVEMDFIQNYISLLKTRHNGALEIDLDVPKDKLDAQIVPVTLQIMIENAIKHNSTTVESPLRIRIYTEGENLVVCNNLQRRLRVDHSNKMGLANLQALYAFLSPVPVTVRETEHEFCVLIPLL
jgi:hypothetical protein